MLQTAPHTYMITGNGKIGRVYVLTSYMHDSSSSSSSSSSSYSIFILGLSSAPANPTSCPCVVAYGANL